MPSRNQNLRRSARLNSASSVPSSPAALPANGIPNRRVRDRKTRDAKFVLLRASLKKPLSQRTTTDPVPFDIDAYVRRPASVRQAETSRPTTAGKLPGHIPRPLNAFLLYRKTYHARARAFSKRVMDCQQGASSVCGVSWHIEGDEVREKFRALAEVERVRHAEAFPSWKYQPRQARAVVVEMEDEMVDDKVAEEIVCAALAGADDGADAVMVPQEDVLGDFDFNFNDYVVDDFNNDQVINSFNNDQAVDNFNNDQYGMYPQLQPEVVIDNAFFDDAFLMAPVANASLVAPAHDDFFMAPVEDAFFTAPVEDAFFQAAAYDPLLLPIDPLLLVNEPLLAANDPLLQAVTAAAEPLPVRSAQVVEAAPVVLCSRCACQVVIVGGDTMPLVPAANGL